MNDIIHEGHEGHEGEAEGPYELPDGWAWTTLEQIYKIVGGGTPSTAMPEYWGGDIPWITSADITGLHDIHPRKTITAEAIKNSATNLVPAGSLIVVTRVGLGKVALTKMPLCFSQDSHALIGDPSIVDPEYAIYFLSEAVQTFKYHNQGTTIPGVTKKQLARLPFALPPIVEQRRIVAKIDELLTSLDAGVAGLKRIQAALKRFRAAVLKAACEGRLVPQDSNDEPAEKLLERVLAERRAKWEADLRAKGKDPAKAKYEEPKGPETEGLPELPESWTWVSWEAILAYEDGAFRRGPFGSNLTKSMFVGSGYKVYEQYCAINDDCSFGRYYITPEKFQELKSFEVKAGDYLVSCSGVTLGRITRVPEKCDKGIINQALLRVRINDSVIRHQYFLHIFRSPFFQKLLFDNSSGTAIPNVKGVKELKAIAIPLPPLDEQNRVVAEIELRLSVANQLEKTVEANLVRAERLRQAILRRAFEGKLVGL